MVTQTTAGTPSVPSLHHHHRPVPLSGETGTNAVRPLVSRLVKHPHIPREKPVLRTKSLGFLFHLLFCLCEEKKAKKKTNKLALRRLLSQRRIQLTPRTPLARTSLKISFFQGQKNPRQRLTSPIQKDSLSIL